MLNNSSKTLKKLIIIFLITALTYSNFVIIGNSMVKGLFSYALDDVEEPVEDKIVAEQSLITNKVCEINGELKRVIQVELTTGIEEDYPIKETTLTLNTGIVSEKLEDVKVTGINRNSYTVATVELKEENKLKINLINKAETLESKEKGLDKLLVTYVYEYVERKEVQDEVLENGIIISSEDKDTENTIQKPLEKLELRTYKDKQVVLKSFAPATFENIEETTNELGILNIENKDIHKTTIKEGAVEYTEKLNLDLSYRNDKTNIIIEDKLNEFYNNDDIVNNEANLKYTKTLMNKDTLLNLLDKDAKLTITDLETGKIITELTKQNIEEAKLGLKTEQKYEEVLSEVEVPSQEIIIENENVEIPSQIIIENEYEEENIVDNTVIENVVVEKKVEESKEITYETRAYVTVTEKTIEIEYVTEVTNMQLKIEGILPQSSIKIEPSNFVVENTKSIYNVQNVDDLKYLNEEVKYILGQEEKVVESKITFKDKVTRAKIEADKTELIIGGENKINYTITLDTETENSELFVNPIFLLELPASVSAVNRENSEFAVKNNKGAFTKKDVFISSLLGKQYVVMMFEGEQTEETIINGNTQISLTLDLNVKGRDNKVNDVLKLYYLNDTVTMYENGSDMGTKEISIAIQQNIEQAPHEEEVKGETEENTNIEVGDEGIELPESNIDTLIELNAENEIVRVGEEFEYLVYINNYETEVIPSLIVENNIPTGLSYIDAKLYNYSQETYDYTDEVDMADLIKYNPETRVLTAEINNFEQAKIIEEENYSELIRQTKLLKIKLKADALEEGLYTKELNGKVQILKNGNKVIEKNVKTVVSDAFIKVTTNQLMPEISHNGIMDFDITIENLGLLPKNVNINMELPEELEVVMVEENYKNSNESYKFSAYGKEYKDNIIINGNDICNLKISVKYLNKVNETKNIVVQTKIDDNVCTWNTNLLDKDILLEELKNNNEYILIKEAN